MEKLEFSSIYDMESKCFDFLLKIFIIIVIIKCKIKSWEQRFWTKNKMEIEKILTNEQIYGLATFMDKELVINSHEYNKLFSCCTSFLKLTPSKMRDLAYAYLKLCEKISFGIYYSLIMNEGRLTYFKSAVIDNDNTIGKVFDEGFLDMMKAILSTRWSGKCLNKQNKITINGIDIHQIAPWEDPINGSQKIAIRKVLLNTFITLFLKNSLDTQDVGGYLGGNEIKNVSIEIDDKSIKIVDIPIVEFYDEKAKDNRIELFNKKNILDLNFHHKTIRAFIGIVDFMKEYGYDYGFSYGFNDSKDFFVELKF